jgi:hypothetical protein
LGRVIAHAIAWVNVFFIPGVFGFLVWELKENWRLYESNRAAGLGPVMVGHHGETLVRLLRPGLHSGTIPKLFAKLRHAERTAHRGGDWRPARKHREALYHVKNGIRHFVDRELVFLLNQSPRWQPLCLAVGTVELGTNRIRIGLECRTLSAANLEIAFDIHAGWLVAGIVEPGWLDQLAEPQRQALLTALTGLYKLAGVDLVREHIDHSLGSRALAYTVAEDRLVVRAESAPEVVYSLRDGERIQPQAVGGDVCKDWPVLSAQELLFRQVAVSWSAWVETWETGRVTEDLARSAARCSPRSPGARG